MNDEANQLRQQTFNQIILGLMAVGIGGGALATTVGGFDSPWLLRALALAIVALVAYLFYRSGRFMVAAYLLVLEMIGLVAGMLLQPNTIYSPIPFLFIPIVIIAGFLLTPTAILVTTGLTITLTLIVLLVTGQLTSSVLLFLTLPLGLTLITALLIVGNALYRLKLDELLSKNRELLRNRTREMLDAQKKVEQLQTRVTALQQELLQAETAAATPLVAPSSDNKFYHLIRGTIRELEHSARNLETTMSKIVEVAPVNGWAGLVNETWHNVDHLASLVINLEELTELEKGEIKLNNRPVDVATLVTELGSSARGLVRGKNIEIIEAAPEENPPLVADPDRIRQLMIYLIHNAIKYTDEGYIDIQAEVADQEVIFSISDSGLGIPEEDLEAIYETFGRSHDSVAKERQGAGLGLAVSKRLVELLGGQAWNVSTPGLGSTFYFSIPLTPPGTPVPSPEPAKTDPQPAPPVDPEATLLSIPAETVPVHPIVQLQAPDSTSPNPEPASVSLPPVARFRSIYNTRFGLSLLGLLLIVGGTVAFLAYLNQSTANQTASTSSTTVASALSNTTATGVTTIITATAQATTPPLPPTATHPPATRPPATAAVSATATPVPSPSATATLSPTATNIPPTSTPSLEPTPLTEVINTATPVPPTATVVVIATATANPLPVVLPTRQLAFVVDGQRLARQGEATMPDSTLKIAVNSRPSWSSTGQLLFTSDQDGNREIYLAEPTSSQPLNLTQHPSDDQHPAWSPTGREMAFSSGRDGSFNLYLRTMGSGDVLQLTNSRGFDEWPAWSPDEQQIAFVSTRDGGNQEIYLIDTDGRNPRRLTNNLAADTTPVWSPDGRHLLFVSERDGNANLYLVEVSGGEIIQLTADPTNELAPVWSPDGQTIAFVVETPEGADIFTMPAPTTPFTVVPRSAWSQITNTPDRESYPAWAP